MSLVMGWLHGQWPRLGALASLWLASLGSRSGVVAPPAPAPVATGRIEGTARIASQLLTVHRRIRVYEEPGAAPPKPADANPLANVVIYLEPSPSLHVETPPMAAIPPVLHQRDETFVPHVLPVVVGTTVQFPNDDLVFHDVFSLSSPRAFDLQRYPQGASRSVPFTRPGVIEVFCHIHSDMSAYILVLDNPFFVIPDPQGHYALEGVPPGDYRMVAWYERTRPVTVQVHVEAGHTATIPMLIPIADVPARP